MLHLGDITKISGYTAPITDCVVGGSPCQDLSIAGKRAGLDGERSGLFMEQIRIIKEMRDRDVRDNGRSGDSVRPRYMVWENVPGAFSSNKGEDFRIVLEETARVKDKDANVPMPNNGKWQTSGCILGDGWSIAWRVLDAQFWGVPQRRRRIALVADFGGHSASEILFVRESVSRDTEQSKPQGKTTPADATRGIGADDSAYTMKIRSGCDVDAHGKSAGKGALIQTEKSGTISCVQDQYLFQPVGCDVYNLAVTDDKVCSLTSSSNSCITSSRNGPYAISLHPVVALDRASYNQGQNAQFDIGIDENGTAQSLVAKGPGAVCYSFDSLDSNSMKSSNPHSGCRAVEVSKTLDTTNPDPSKNQGGMAVVERESMASNNINCNNVVRTRYTVRRLTPLECERLQGYPSEYKVDVSQMNKDEYIAYNIIEGNIIVDAEAGKVYRTRGPGGIKLDKPQEMKGSDSNGYLVVKISNGTTKMTCRVHRIVWISQHGVIPEGYCVDHINSDKKDNRISNLQLLTHQENSTKAAEDGLYPTGEDNHATKVSPDLWDGIAYLHHCEGKTMRELAEVYGISKSRVQQIIKEVGWTDIGEYIDSNGKKKQSSDAARYKALGNSIALPPWKWVMKRLCACYERDATLASLFDGLGGFPKIWEEINGKGSCLWASEVEEFCIAVTKARIGE